MVRLLSGVLSLLLLLGGSLSAALAQENLEPGGVNPGYHEPPPWFKVSFLDLQEDIQEAAADDKRLLIYFYQDGCPYCAKLLEDNFGQKVIADKTQKHFDVVSINMWGDREVIDFDGNLTTEKQFAQSMKVMFTPTLVFFDEAAKPVLRLNGYYYPHKFTVALDFASGKQDLSFADFMAAADPKVASGKLHQQPFFMKPPYFLDRSRVPAQQHLLVLFEQKQCLTCDELHGDILMREKTLEYVNQLDVVRLDRWSNERVITPDGTRTTARQWADELGIQFSPTFVYFDERGREVFRSDAYLKAFHTQSVMDYVTSKAYLDQPSLQRFIEARADHLREQGIEVDLWK